MNNIFSMPSSPSQSPSPNRKPRVQRGVALPAQTGPTSDKPRFAASLTAAGMPGFQNPNLPPRSFMGASKFKFNAASLNTSPMVFPAGRAGQTRANRQIRDEDTPKPDVHAELGPSKREVKIPKSILANPVAKRILAQVAANADSGSPRESHRAIQSATEGYKYRDIVDSPFPGQQPESVGWGQYTNWKPPHVPAAPEDAQSLQSILGHDDDVQNRSAQSNTVQKKPINITFIQKNSVEKKSIRREPINDPKMQWPESKALVELLSHHGHRLHQDSERIQEATRLTTWMLENYPGEGFFGLVLEKPIARLRTTQDVAWEEALKEGVENPKNPWRDSVRRLYKRIADKEGQVWTYRLSAELKMEEHLGWITRKYGVEVTQGLKRTRGIDRSRGKETVTICGLRAAVNDNNIPTPSHDPHLDPALFEDTSIVPALSYHPTIASQQAEQLGATFGSEETRMGKIPEEPASRETQDATAIFFEDTRMDDGEQGQVSQEMQQDTANHVGDTGAQQMKEELGPQTIQHSTATSPEVTRKAQLHEKPSSQQNQHSTFYAPEDTVMTLSAENPPPQSLQDAAVSLEDEHMALPEEKYSQVTKNNSAMGLEDESMAEPGGKLPFRATQQSLSLDSRDSSEVVEIRKKLTERDSEPTILQQVAGSSTVAARAGQKKGLSPPPQSKSILGLRSDHTNLRDLRKELAKRPTQAEMDAKKSELVKVQKDLNERPTAAQLSAKDSELEDLRKRLNERPTVAVYNAAVKFTNQLRRDIAARDSSIDKLKSNIRNTVAPGHQLRTRVQRRAVDNIRKQFKFFTKRTHSQLGQTITELRQKVNLLTYNSDLGYAVVEEQRTAISDLKQQLRDNDAAINGFSALQQKSTSRISDLEHELEKKAAHICRIPVQPITASNMYSNFNASQDSEIVQAAIQGQQQNYDGSIASVEVSVSDYERVKFDQALASRISDVDVQSQPETEDHSISSFQFREVKNLQQTHQTRVQLTKELAPEICPPVSPIGSLLGRRREPVSKHEEAANCANSRHSLAESISEGISGLECYEEKGLTASTLAQVPEKHKSATHCAPGHAIEAVLNSSNAGTQEGPSKNIRSSVPRSANESRPRLKSSRTHIRTKKSERRAHSHAGAFSDALAFLRFLTPIILLVLSVILARLSGPNYTGSAFHAVQSFVPYFFPSIGISFSWASVDQESIPYVVMMFLFVIMVAGTVKASILALTNKSTADDDSYQLSQDEEVKIDESHGPEALEVWFCLIWTVLMPLFLLFWSPPLRSAFFITASKCFPGIYDVVVELGNVAKETFFFCMIKAMNGLFAVAGLWAMCWIYFKVVGLCMED